MDGWMAGLVPGCKAVLWLCIAGSLEREIYVGCGSLEQGLIRAQHVPFSRTAPPTASESFYLFIAQAYSVTVVHCVCVIQLVHHHKPTM